MNRRRARRLPLEQPINPADLRLPGPDASRRPPLLLLVPVAGFLFLWAVQAGYGILALVLLALAGGLALWLWIRTLLATGKQQREERQHQRAQARMTLSAQHAEIEAVRRRARADEIKAQAMYLKAEAEAGRLTMRVEQDQAALSAGLHYPGTHGYPVYIGNARTGQPPRILPTDYRALLPRKGGEQPGEALPGQAPAVIGQLPLPGPLRDIDVLRGWDLRPDHVYLATGRGGQHVSCSLEGWGHIAHDARTGGGKTLLARVELAMMLVLHVDLVLCNPHFAPLDKRGHDWRPIGFQLERQGPVEIAPGVRVSRIQRKAEAIARLLNYLAKTELDRRYDLQAQGRFDWKPLSIFLDEVPWLVHEHPSIAADLIILLQRGRAVDVRVLTNAQSFLVGNTGLKGGNGGRFDTVHFLGGNPRSGATLLGLSERDLKELVGSVQTEANQALGKGLELLRNLESVPKAQPARVPFGTNDLQYYWLGRHDDWQLPEFRRAQQQQMPGAEEATHPYWTWDDRANVFYQPGPNARIVDAETEAMAARRVQPPLVARVPAPSHTGQPPLAEPQDATSGPRPKAYRLSDAEISPFLAAYTACGNIDKALAMLGHGARYRKHANELLQANGLREKGADHAH